MNNEEFARRLKEWRKAHGITQKQLGEMLGINRYAISKYEKAKNLPSCDIAQRLSEITGLDVPSSRPFARHINETLTEDERQFATIHYRMVNVFLCKRGLSYDEWWDISVIGYLKAVKLWFSRNDLHVYSFSTIAFHRMWSAVCNELKKRKRRVKCVSLDDVIPNTDGLTYGDMLCDPRDCVGI